MPVVDEPQADAPPAPEAATAATSEPEAVWVPSYSVSRQGSRSSLLVQEEPKAAEEEEEDAPVPAPVIVTSSEDVEESATAPAEAIAVETPAEKAPSRPWTPSYSVSRQGSRSSLVAKEESSASTEPAAALAEVSEPSALVARELVAEPEDEATSDKAPSRPWTPSYSVSRQGSRSSLKEAASAQDAPATVVVTPSEETSAAAEPVTLADKAPSRPWTPSYSVSRQGSRSELVPKEEQSTEDVPEAPAAVVVTPSEEVVEQPIAQPAPKRPWTPSYSVSRQGSTHSLRADAAAQDAIKAPEQEKAPSRPWTPSYSVSRQGSVPVSPKAPSTELAEPAVAAPARPWTPSYSVSRQGSKTDLTEEPKAEIVEEPAASTPVIAVEGEPVDEVDIPVVSEPIAIHEKEVDCCGARSDVTVS